MFVRLKRDTNEVTNTPVESAEDTNSSSSSSPTLAKTSTTATIPKTPVDSVSDVRKNELNDQTRGWLPPHNQTTTLKELTDETIDEKITKIEEEALDEAKFNASIPTDAKFGGKEVRDLVIFV